MGKTRLSNIELLRILCMFGVLINHVLQTLYNLNSPDFSLPNEFRILLMNSAIIAVNCFVLISGFFRIKIKSKGFLNLYFQCLFYNVLLFGLAYFITGEGLQYGIKSIIFPFTESRMWFFKAYIALYLISPLLNAGYDNLSRNKRFYVLTAFLIIDVYLGYMHQAQEVTPDGYHVIHFITLYFIGCIIADYKQYLPKKRVYIAWFLILVSMNILHHAKLEFFPIAILYSLKYNSPMVMLSSVVFFIWFSNLRIQSKIINYISISVLSVYIIHLHPFVWDVLFDFLKYIQRNMNLMNAAIFISLSLIVFYMCCIFVDKIRISICLPLVRIGSHHIDSFVQKIKVRIG